MMMESFLLFLQDNVMVDHRPMGSASMEEVRDVVLPMAMERVPPGLNSVIEGIVLVDVDSL